MTIICGSGGYDDGALSFGTWRSGADFGCCDGFFCGGHHQQEQLYSSVA
jgi:hypothetical protein